MTVGIIPVHLGSLRLQRKAIIDICGLPMVIHVLFRAQMCKELDHVYVATDSMEIKQLVEQYGGQVLMTSSEHENGTSRCSEAVQNIDADYIVTIFGDEALLVPDHITKSVRGLQESDADASILVIPYDQFNTPTSVKVVLNKKHQIMYMSRSDIPSNVRKQPDYMYKAYHVLTYRKPVLVKYRWLEKTYLESIEYNEHLRLLENGYSIQAVEVEYDCVSVDDANTLNYVRNAMRDDPLFKLYKGKS